jgi:hypothetical protein
MDHGKSVTVKSMTVFPIPPTSYDHPRIEQTPNGDVKIWERYPGTLPRLNGPAKIVPIKRTHNNREYQDYHMEWWIDGQFIADNTHNKQWSSCYNSNEYKLDERAQEEFDKQTKKYLGL